MTKIVISGAAGQLGRLITREVLDRVPASDVTLTSRYPASLSDEAAKGMRVCQADYRDLASLEAAYEGCDVLMLISSLNILKRIPEHQNAIQAAKQAGIKHIVYTSVSGVHPANKTPSSSDHYATEQMLHASGIGFTALRNQMYAEFVTPMAESALITGQWNQVGDKGMFSPVSRADIARCAATILCAPEQHRNVCYEITGPELLSFKEIAKRFADMYGQPIEYVPQTAEQMWALFDAWGVPRVGDTEAPVPHCFGSNELVENYVAWDQLYHGVLSQHVELITGNKPTPLHDIMLAAKEATVARLAEMKKAGEMV